jgi:bis(5'-nucleosyl)-tetraphosphatase (symmetrical)
MHDAEFDGLNDEPPGLEPPAPHRFTYAIGDVQGCFDDLLRLLDHIDFDSAHDQLWFTGDLVNRGPDSLALLRYVKGLGQAAVSVLGNHDLYLLAVAAGTETVRDRDTITEILKARDCEDLLFWLRHQPLLYHDEHLGYTMVHAGLPPQWDLEQAMARASELERVLQNFDYEDFFKHLSWEEPHQWHDGLEGWGRLRFIANCFTQLRYCDGKGRLDLTGERRRASGVRRSMPWFEVPGRASASLRILFGHWAGLSRSGRKMRRVYALDSGCANGGRFTAYQLEEGVFFQVQCKNEQIPWDSSRHY